MSLPEPWGKLVVPVGHTGSEANQRSARLLPAIVKSKALACALQMVRVAIQAPTETRRLRWK